MLMKYLSILEGAAKLINVISRLQGETHVGDSSRIGPLVENHTMRLDAEMTNDVVKSSVPHTQDSARELT